MERQSKKSTTVKMRKKFLSRFGQSNTLYKFTASLYKIYYSLTGRFHVIPDFYIIGAAKCGTSALYDYLIQHPSVYSAVTKEPRFFDKYYGKGLNWYKVLFPLKVTKFFITKILQKDFVTGEATPRYLDHPHAPKRIQSITPNAKFIILLRNPADRIFSHYNMRKSSKKETLPLHDALKLEAKRTKDEFEHMVKDENYYSLDYYHHSYLDRSIYINKLERWMKVFPKEQFLIIQSEIFFSNSDKVLQNVLKFLKLPEFHLKEYSKIDTGKYKKSKMDPSLRIQLLEQFVSHNEKLYSFLGTRFDWDK